MDDGRATIEEAAASENTWVRARILKRKPPAEGSLLDIATRARDMAARSLGTAHPAYAVALQNLGLYYDAIENDGAKAAEYFRQARAVVNENDDPLAYGLQRLGIFHLQIKSDPERAEEPLTEALAIQRRTPGTDDLQLAETLVALAWVKMVGDPGSAIDLMAEALAIRRAKLPPGDSAIAEAEGLLTMLQAMDDNALPEVGDSTAGDFQG